MKIGFRWIFYITFLMTLTTYSYEWLSLVTYRSSLEKGGFGVPKGSRTYKYANNTPSYIPSMLRAVSSKFSVLQSRQMFLCLYIVISTVFLIRACRIALYNVLCHLVSVYCKSLGSIQKEQIAFTNVFLFLFVTLYMNGYIEQYYTINDYKLVGKVIFYILLYIVVCPLICVMLFFFIQNFGVQFILAVYLSLLLKTVYEVFVDNGRSPNLTKISYSIFDRVVKDYLFKEDLKNKVYVNKSVGDTNAALVGLGNNTSIELYGDFENLPHRQQDSVLLHEIGHSVDHSLVKKLSVYLLVYLCEMALIVYLYKYEAQHIKCENISHESAFIILTMIYFYSTKEWITFFYKLSSQRAEKAADLLAKNEGFGNELAKSLFDISVNESSYIRPTWLYNSLYAMHASIYDRIEYLTE